MNRHTRIVATKNNPRKAPAPRVKPHEEHRERMERLESKRYFRLAVVRFLHRTYCF